MANQPTHRRPQFALGAFLAALACVPQVACDSTALDSAAAARPATACGRMDLLEGRFIRLAQELPHAALRVVPITLTPSQGRWVLQDGWRQEPDGGALLVAASGTLIVSEPACPGGDASSDPFSLELAAYHERYDTAQPIAARLVARGATIDEARLQPPQSMLTLEAAGFPDPASRKLEIQAEPTRSLTLQRMTLTVGRASVELRREYRDAIVASSAREVAFRILVPPGARFEFAVAATGRPIANADTAAIAPPAREGASSVRSEATAEGSWRFRAEIVAGEDRRELFAESVPSAAAESDAWHERSIDLSPWGGQTVDLVLAAEPMAEASPLALWGSPIVLTDDRGPTERPDILLVSIDTLRADRVGREVRHASLTPNLNRLATEGTLFTQARTQAPSTLYGHATMLTGLPPSAHGATSTSALPDGVPYLPALLADSGYATAAITDDGLLDGRFGFNRGFDRFRNRFETVEEKIEAALAMAADLPRPWFLFLHTYEVHAPYDPPVDLAQRLLGDAAVAPASLAGVGKDILVLTRVNNDIIPVSKNDIGYLESLYDAEVVRTDAALGRLFAGLRARGLWDGAVVAVTSDHGEEFDEHGVIGWHALTCYEEVQRVPLVVKPARGDPGHGRRIEEPIASLDIAPTLLDLAGLAAPRSMWGRSAAALMAGAGPWPPRETLCEIESGHGAAILMDGWKYHQRTDASAADRRTFRRRLRTFGRYGTEELYRLDIDPLEQVNLAADEPERARAMRRELESRLASARAQQSAIIRSGSGAPRPLVDEEHLKRLKSLGYVQ